MAPTMERRPDPGGRIALHRFGNGTDAVAVPPIRHLLDQNGEVIEGVGRQDIESRLDNGHFFWLDLPQIGDEEISWLRDVFCFHPLAIDDATNFNERPKLEEFDDYTFLVMYGSASPFEEFARTFVTEEPGSRGEALPDVQDLLRRLDILSEVHCFISERFVVTIHRHDCPAFHGLVKRLKARQVKVQNPSRLVYRVADTLVDSFFPVLSELDDQIDSLQSQIIERPKDSQLGVLLDFRRALLQLRRVIAPQRDIFAGLASGVNELPGFSEQSQRYFRDIYDHLIRLSDLADAYRDLLSGTTDAYLSVVSNQLNVVMKQLTILSTVFLPLAFLTGFFGQNFSWLDQAIGGLPVFVGVGIGTEVVAVVAMMWLFRRRGWLGGG